MHTASPSRSFAVSPPSSWVGEVKVWALTFAMADARGMTDAQYLTWSLALNTEVLSSRAYRVLTRLASPALRLRGASLRWGAFHRGTDFELAQTGDRRAAVVLRYPSFMLNELAVRSHADALRLALENSRARRVTVDVDHHDERSARLQATWE